MHIDANTALLAILTTGVGYVMVVAGLHKSMLEWRRSTRSCPSCGRAITERVCMNCARS
jgi:NADH pyrophosphatase NudC (nudix superfamily)